MKNLFLLTVLTFLLFIAARPGVAEVVEIPLDHRAGAEPWGDHTVAFDAGHALPDIARISLRLQGEAGAQEYIGCEAPYPWNHGFKDGRLEVDLREAETETWIQRVTLGFGDGPRAPIDLEVEFPAGDFAAIESGTGLLEFDEPARMFFSDPNWICPVGNGCVITTATLVIEYGDLVDSGSVTWSTLKAIYR